MRLTCSPVEESCSSIALASPSTVSWREGRSSSIACAASLPAPRAARLPLGGDVGRDAADRADLAPLVEQGNLTVWKVFAPPADLDGVLSLVRRALLEDSAVALRPISSSSEAMIASSVRPISSPGAIPATSSAFRWR